MVKIKIGALSGTFLLFFVFSGCSIQTSKPDNKGGVYKSQDGGMTFEQKVKIDENSSLANSTILAMAFDPDDSNTIYAGAPTGLYRTTNGGDDWQKLQNDFKKVRDIVIDPSNPDVIYVPTIVKGTGKIMRTTNKGEEWEEMFTQRTPEGSVFSVVVDYEDPNIIYAGDSSGAIYKTNDGGDTWKTLLWNKGGIKKIEIDNVNHEKIYFVSTKSKSQRTDYGGENFIELSSDGFIYNLLAHPYQENVVYISDKQGLHRSDDGGITLTQFNTLVRPEQMGSRAIAIDPKNDKIVYFASGKAVYKTVNGGETWKPVQFNIPRRVQMMLIDPKNTDILYLGTQKAQSKKGMKFFPF